MTLLFDSDGLIKLQRAGVLARVVKAFECAIPEAVYREAVTIGKARLYQDAEEIGRTIDGVVEVVRVDPVRPEEDLGVGETAVAALAALKKGAIVVSDDRRFLAHLSSLDIRFVTPSDLLVVLMRRRVLTVAEARQALERLRPLVRPAAFWEARNDLENGGRDEG